MPLPPPPTLTHFSVSQVETAELCLRKWAFAKLDGLEEEAKASLDDGSTGHSLVEAYLTKGDVPDPSQRMGREALSLIASARLPVKHPGVKVEQYYEVLVAPSAEGPGFKILGYLDVWVPVRKSGRPLVMDHKFLGSFRWAKTSGDLDGSSSTPDVQGTLYALWALLTTKAPAVDLQWNCAQKGSRKVLLVTARATAASIAERVRQTFATCRRMLAAREHAAKRAPKTKKRYHALSLPPSPDGCAKYGGCSFCSICKLSDEDRLVADMTLRHK